MEAVEEHLAERPTADVVKSNTVENTEAAVAVAADLCHNSNGVAEIGKAGQSEAPTDGNDTGATPETGIDDNSTIGSDHASYVKEANELEVSLDMDICTEESDKTNITEITIDDQPNQDINTLDVDEVITEVIIDDELEKTVGHNVDLIEVSVLETSSNDTPKFKTEILVEANDSTADIPETTLNDAAGHDTTNNILSEFGESIELSEVLRSDVAETSENNNGSVRQEIFNKEELLDILEGKDVEPSPPISATEVSPALLTASKEIETKLALQQLSRLKREKRKYRGTVRMTKVKKDKKENVVSEKVNHNEVGSITEKKKLNQSNETAVSDNISNIEVESDTEKKKAASSPTDNIVNVLVMDWDDEDQDPNDIDQPKEVLVESENLLIEREKLKLKQDAIVSQEKPSVRSSVDSVPSEDQAQRGKSGDENQPQRRFGRVIKKKVIFDPDNPDTFTKTKTKIREPTKDHVGKVHPPFKKVKNEQTSQRPKSKSPMANLQWKKPSSKNSKQNRRLTEVDRLLMDEGAVNMIYQLTSEAPKGKKSRETKAEFIKKIQSSTPDGKEMKFRERKKESLKYEDGDPKKILGIKHRVSLNSSMKSPSVSEDFETHSADDSIIYRRHSSSSYSSSCMSPRRLSDVESNVTQINARNSLLASENQRQGTANAECVDQESDVFMAEDGSKSRNEVINKDDYLSIKEKLNSKLSLALNKRKRESIKNDKPLKQKKVTRNDLKHESLKTSLLEEFKHVTIKIDHRLAEICVEKPELQYGIEVLKEIEQALVFINSVKDTSVTLLTSECGTLYSNLDLNHVLDEDKIKRVNNALEVAETIRALLLAVDKHSKLLCSGVQAACRGVGLAVVALSDVVLASEHATFALSSDRGSPQPGAAALTARCRLPHSMANDLILFGRQLSASEALQGGLVSRVLWPDRFKQQVYNIAKDMASEPISNVMLKKQLINLKKIGENEQTFLSCLDTERDIFVEYWTSVEGQELLRAVDDAA